MTDATTTPAAETAAPATAAKKAVKKAVKKAAKKVVKKAVKKTGKKVARQPREYTGPGKTQLRILTALAKAANGLTGSALAEKAKVDLSMIGMQAGYRDPEINSREVHKNNLLNRGLVKLSVNDEEKNVYVITAAGRKALAK